ncbi:hypothetical protein SUGI_1495540 [Cryptomeria japonica]|uniref:Uncharacterized protein n=1 Tax=Cryptomeria japonica TaxID=3369 RepID=A0AAD3NTX1_CRYJA|nr:hypothetical protein SUGI_1495540 [Cryptomeria japonica]
MIGSVRLRTSGKQKLGRNLDGRNNFDGSILSGTVCPPMDGNQTLLYNRRGINERKGDRYPSLPINTRAVKAALLCAGTERIGSLRRDETTEGHSDLERHFLLHLRLTGTLSIGMNRLLFAGRLWVHSGRWVGRK